MARTTEKKEAEADRVTKLQGIPSAKSQGKRKAAKKARERRYLAVMSRGYVVFLAIMCIVTVLMCIRYLRLKETITRQVKQNNELRTKLTNTRAENDALLESIQNSVDMNHIREVAINEFGMKYATEDQVIWYNSEDNGYVEQYRDVS